MHSDRSFRTLRVQRRTATPMINSPIPFVMSCTFQRPAHHSSGALRFSHRRCRRLYSHAGAMRRGSFHQALLRTYMYLEVAPSPARVRLPR